MLVTDIVNGGHIEVTVVPVILVVGYPATAGVQVVVKLAKDMAEGGWRNCTFSPVVDRSIIQSDGRIKTGFIG